MVATCIIVIIDIAIYILWQVTMCSNQTLIRGILYTVSEHMTIFAVLSVVLRLVCHIMHILD